MKLKPKQIVNNFERATSRVLECENEIDKLKADLTSREALLARTEIQVKMLRSSIRRQVLNSATHSNTRNSLMPHYREAKDTVDGVARTQKALDAMKQKLVNTRKFKQFFNTED